MLILASRSLMQYSALFFKQEHKEKDLQQALINGLKNFILELGKDFCFVGQDYKIEVGNISILK